MFFFYVNYYLLHCDCACEQTSHAAHAVLKPRMAFN